MPDQNGVFAIALLCTAGFAGVCFWLGALTLT